MNVGLGTGATESTFAIQQPSDAATEDEDLTLRSATEGMAEDKGGEKKSSKQEAEAEEKEKRPSKRPDLKAITKVHVVLCHSSPLPS